MDFGILNASLYEVNGLNPHNLRRVRTGISVRQQVLNYKRSRPNNSQGFASRAIDNAIGRELIGSVKAIAVVGRLLVDRAGNKIMAVSFWDPLQAAPPDSSRRNTRVLWRANFLPSKHLAASGGGRTD